MSQRPLHLLALFVCLLGCDRGNPVAPNGTILLVTANPTAIGLTGSSTITIRGFRPDGNPLYAGTQITVGTSLGTLSANLVEIGDDGRVTVILTGDGRSGSATVSAVTSGSSLPPPPASGGGAGGGGGATSVMASVTVLIGETAETKPTLSLTATPDTIALGATSVITALVRRADGSAFGAGGVVHFRTNLGRITSEATTDANSQARATLTAGDQPGTATVTASIGSSDEKTATVTVENRRPIVIGFANPSNIPASTAESPSTSHITLFARDDNNVPLGAGLRIRLTADRGSVEPSEVLTDRFGEAEATFTAGEQTGNGGVTAILGSSDPEVIPITIGPPPPTANFDFDFNGCVVLFFDLSLDATSRSWNFGDPASGDQNTSTVQDPTHTYPANGTYTVTLTVRSSVGSDTESRLVEVTGCA